MNIGDRVRVINSMLYTGQHGELAPISDDPEDFWDWSVILDSGRRISVYEFQVVPE